MTVEIQSSLTDGKHARVLHKGNRFTVRSITASSEVSGYEGVAADNGLTFDRWKPFSNAVLDPAGEYDSDEWSENVEIEVGADGQTIGPTTASSTHYIQQPITVTAEEWVYAVRVERQTVDRVLLRIRDGAGTQFRADFLLTDLTIPFTSSATGEIIDLGDNLYELRIYATMGTAGSGDVRVQMQQADGTVTYVGAGETVKVHRVVAHASAASLRYDLFDAAAGDVFAIAAHNLGSGAGRIVFEHDSNEDGTWTQIGSALDPVDDSPIMFFHDGVTSIRWRISIDRCVLPEIGVFRVGAALKMERPFYGGFQPSLGRRTTVVRGNRSEGGEWLGRSVVRRGQTAAYQWANLTFSWARSNLFGADGLIRAVETEPFFLAWRPSELDDVDYAWTGGPIDGPTNTGTRDLVTFGFSAEVHGYE